MSNGARVILAVLMFTMLGLCCAGCGGGAASGVGTQVSSAQVRPFPQPEPAPGAQSSSWPTSLPVDQWQPWEAQDGGSEARPTAARFAASIDSNSEFVPGVERYLDGGTVAELGEALAISSGNQGELQVSHAIYRLDLGSAQPGAVAADVNLYTKHGGSAKSDFYLALSDFSRGRWEWHGPFSDSHVRLSSGAAARAGTDYTSPLGHLFICIVAYDGTDCDVVGVGANPLELADVAAPPAPAGLTATPVAQGLLLGWNGVIAADLAGYRIYWRQAAFSSPGDPGVQQVAYLEGMTRHVLLLPSTAAHSVAVAAVDLNGNESPLSAVISAAPLAGAAPELRMFLDQVSVQQGGVVSLTAFGAESYDFDLDGDGVFDLTNTTGLASVATTAPGLIRPLVRGSSDGTSRQALGGVSLVVYGNTRPVASASATPTTGTAPLAVTFTGEASDIEDIPSTMTYAWDFDGDGTYEPGTNSLTPPAHNYTAAGLYHAKFRAADSQGVWDVDTLSILVEPKSGVDYTLVRPNHIYDRINATLVGGLAAIAYQDDVSLDIYYIRASRPDATTWGAPVLVTAEDEPLGGISLAIVNGNPAIAFTGSTDFDILYVRASTPQGTAWGPVAIVDSADTVGGTLELVTAAGYPAIGYHNFTTTQPRFVRALDANGDAWGIPAGFSASDSGFSYSTAIVGGRPAMTYSHTGTNKTYYVRATNDTGSAWGVAQEVLTFDACYSTDLQEINGHPCVILGGNGGIVYFNRAADTVGDVWYEPSIAAQKTVGMMTSPWVVLGQRGGDPVAAIVDGSSNTLLLTESVDQSGKFWHKPQVLAPFDFMDGASQRPCLLPLNGALAVVYRLYSNSTSSYQLWLCRSYD